MRLSELAYRLRAKLRPAPGSRITGHGGQSFLLVGRTDGGGQVLVCAPCRGFEEPHFFFRYGRGREICLLLEDARPMEPHDNLPLSRRWELERFFRQRRAPGDPTNWEQAMAAWNAYNACQVPEQLHRPFYVNLLQREDWATAFTRRGKFALRIGTDDCEPRPHFHYVRPDGTGAAVSLTEPAWLSPAEDRLSPEERSELAAVLAGPAPSYYFPGTVYQALLALWNDQNGGDSFHAPVDEDAAMPDYSRLSGPPLP